MTFWSAPEWWVERPGDDTDVSLAALTQSYARKVAASADRGGAHPSWFGGELQRWCRLLGQSPWITDEIDATTVMYATQGVRNKYRDSNRWEAISRLLGEYAHPLARYALGFTADVDEWRPSVGTDHRGAVRECARSVVKDVRAALVNPARSSGSVLASRNALGDFLARPDAGIDSDRRVAAQAYARNLLQYGSVVDDRDLETAINHAVAEMGTEFGFTHEEAEAGVRRPTGAHRDKAQSRVWAVALEKRAAERTDFYDELIRRSIRKVELRMAKGDPLPDADQIFNQTWRDLEIEERRPGGRKSHETPLEPEILNEVAVADPRAGQASYAKAQAHVEQKMLLEDALAYLRNIEIDADAYADATCTSSEFWEKTVALSILGGETMLGLQGRSSVRKVVVDLWTAQSGRPPAAMCTNRRQAAQLVEGLLHLAISRTLTDIEDFPDWIGRDNDQQTWIQRISAVDQALGALRERSPQDMYDELFKDGEAR